MRSSVRITVSLTTGSSHTTDVSRGDGTDGGELVIQLKKSLSGLAQSPGNWFNTIDPALESTGSYYRSLLSAGGHTESTRLLTGPGLITWALRVGR